MVFFKKFSKLDDIAFHLISHSNKKKLKLNLLLTKDWESIIGERYYVKTRLKNISFYNKTDSCSIDIACDPSIVLELRSNLSKITLKIESAIGVKVKKINFFQDIFEDNYKMRGAKDSNNYLVLENTNKKGLNDIKDIEVLSIFERINSYIKNEKK